MRLSGLALQLQLMIQTYCNMKTRILFIALVALLSSCNLMIIEPAFDDRDRITGSFQLEERSQTYNDYSRYFIYIRKTGVYDEVIIENFYSLGINIRAQVVYDKIYISRQRVNGYEIEGIGTNYGSKIEFSYHVRDTYSYNKPTDYCNATAWFD
jgi:hypothetical protein